MGNACHRGNFRRDIKEIFVNNLKSMKREALPMMSACVCRGFMLPRPDQQFNYASIIARSEWVNFRWGKLLFRRNSFFSFPLVRKHFAERSSGVSAHITLEARTMWWHRVLGDDEYSISNFRPDGAARHPRSPALIQFSFINEIMTRRMRRNRKTRFINAIEGKKCSGIIDSLNLIRFHWRGMEK